jgi:hypothetical protein
MFYTGCVENRNDPLKLGRCQVRILGLHTENKINLPTYDLPWAYPLGSINSASISGLGWSPTGVVQGTWVLVIFMDEDKQQPIMLGTIGGIPQTKSAMLISDATGGDLVTTDDSGELTNTFGSSVTDIIDSIADGEPKGVTQETSNKYHINAVTVQLSTGSSTTYEVISNETDIVVSRATYNENTKKYDTELLKPEQYEDFQYLPFKGTTKPFTDQTDILTYFDTNF